MVGSPRSPGHGMGTPRSQGRRGLELRPEAPGVRRAGGPEILGPRLGKVGPQRHQAHLLRTGPPGGATYQAPARPPHRLRGGQGLPHPPVRSSARGPRAGRIRLVLADYINTEISARADTCHDDVHYKAIDNGRWYILGRYVEPPPGQYPCLPADNSDGRNQAGNVYEALVGLYWLEGKYQDLTDLFLTLMDLDQIEYAGWTAQERRTSTGFLRGTIALRCSDFVFTNFGRDFEYRNGGPSPAPGAVAEPRLPSISPPGRVLDVPHWNRLYGGSWPQGNPRPPPPSQGSAPRCKAQGRWPAGARRARPRRPLQHVRPPRTGPEEQPRRDHVDPSLPGNPGQRLSTGVVAARGSLPQHGTSHSHAHGPHRPAPHLLP